MDAAFRATALATVPALLLGLLHLDPPRGPTGPVFRMIVLAWQCALVPLGILALRRRVEKAEDPFRFVLRRTAPPESRLPWLLLLPAAWALLTLEAALLDEFHDDGRPAWTLEVLFAESWPFWPGALAVWAALAFVPWNRLAWSWSAPLRVLLRMAWIGIYPVGITYVACVLYSHALGEDFEFESIWIPQGLRGTFHRVLLDLGTLSSVLVAGTLLHAPPVPHGSRVELQADRVLHPATWLPATVFGIALGLGLFDVRPFRWLLDRPEPVLIVWMSLVSIELVAQALTRRESARRAPRVR